MTGSACIPDELDRRDMMTGIAVLGATALVGPASAVGAPSTRQAGFPKGFLWGAATAAHQVEGNNVGSDSWLLEHVPGTIYAEPSGDACDSFARYPEDIRLLAGLGLNTYRFSLEWARIEPENSRAFAAIRGGPGDFPVGVSIAMADEQGVGSERFAAAKRAYLYDGWLEAARTCDFIGVQTYTRNRAGPDGDLPVPAGAARSQLGQEVYPQALANTVRYAAARARVPVYVTENGLATEDDALRTRTMDQALIGLRDCWQRASTCAAITRRGVLDG